MKARQDDRRIFGDAARDIPPVRPNIHAIQSSAGLDWERIAETLTKEKTIKLVPDDAVLRKEEPTFWNNERQPVLSQSVKADVTKQQIINLLQLFEHGRTFGSLITVPDDIALSLNGIVDLLRDKRIGNLEEEHASDTIKPFVRSGPNACQ